MNLEHYKQYPLPKLFATYVSTNVLSMMGLSLNVFTDTFFIANGIGSRALAALNIALPVFSAITGIGLMIGMGAATRFTILRAGKNSEEGNRMFSHGLFAALVSSILFMVFGIFFAKDISIMLGANKEVLALVQQYVQTIMICSGAFFFNHCIICFVRNDGAPKLSMCAMLCGNLVNIIFDYIFIYPMNMGLFGAAFATCFSPIVSMLILSSHFIRKKNTFKAIKCKIEIIKIIHIIQIGASSFINEMSSGIVMLAFNYSLLNQIGNIGIAAYGIIANLALVFQAVFTGLGQGIQPIISHAYGAKDHASIKKLMRYGMICGIAFGIIFCFSGILFPDFMVAIFNSEGNAQLAQIAVDGIRLYFPAFLMMGINIVMISFFASVNAPKPSLTISLLRGFILVLFFIFLLPMLLGVNGIWMSIPCAEIITGFIGITILIVYFKKQLQFI